MEDNAMIDYTKCKTCDLPKLEAARLFKQLNGERITINGFSAVGCTPEIVIKTDVEPRDLIYPDGWYYAKGTFRNKHTSTTGIYEEVSMLTRAGESWASKATSSTREI